MTEKIFIGADGEWRMKIIFKQTFTDLRHYVAGNEVDGTLENQRSKV